MKLSMKQTLAIALLAGSTLSVVPAIAQTQDNQSGQDGSNQVLPRKAQARLGQFVRRQTGSAAAEYGLCDPTAAGFGRRQ